MNFQYYFLMLLTVLGFNFNRPVRLQKKETLREKINCWVYIHRFELLLAIAIIAMFTFALVVFLLIGSATDSGNIYNHMRDVI